MTEFLHQPGLFGTAANMAADVTLLIMVIVGALFTIGAVLALRKKYGAHRWVQTATVAVSTIMVLWMMVLPFRDFILPGVPDQAGERFYAVTILHAIVGAVALPFGLFVTLRGNELLPNRLKFSNYKPFMRAAYALYMLTIFLGLWVYFTWFVNNPNPPVFE